MSTITRVLGRAANAPLRPLGLELKRLAAWSDDTRGFLPFEATLAAAAAAGQSVSDYVDVTYNRAHATPESVERMAELGAFAGRIDRICEIGPGSGRYLDLVKKRCQPSYYEIYETADDWAGWLVERHGVQRQPCDGLSLSATPAASIDLVMAHKVFPSVPTLVTIRYLIEMARVVRPGGKLLFDVVTEKCLDAATIDRWLSSGKGYDHFPTATQESVMLDVLGRRGVSPSGRFIYPMEPGTTECFLFVKAQ